MVSNNIQCVIILNYIVRYNLIYVYHFIYVYRVFYLFPLLIYISSIFQNLNIILLFKTVFSPQCIKCDQVDTHQYLIFKSQTLGNAHGVFYNFLEEVFDLQKCYANPSIIVSSVHHGCMRNELIRGTHDERYGVSNRGKASGKLSIRKFIVIKLFCRLQNTKSSINC